MKIIAILVVLITLSLSTLNYQLLAEVKSESKFSFEIDGKKDDWANIKPRVEDEKGDTKGNINGTDIKAVYTEFDENFLYVMFDVWEKPASGRWAVCVDLDNDFDYEYGFVFTKGNSWAYDQKDVKNYVWPENKIINQHNMKHEIDDVVELSIPLLLIENPSYAIMECWIYWAQGDVTPDAVPIFDVTFADCAIMDNIPRSHIINDVPVCSQDWNPYCGLFSLASVMKYWGSEIDEFELAKKLDPERNGTFLFELVDSAHENGFETYQFDKYLRRGCLFRSSNLNELKMWISFDHPVIVIQRPLLGVAGPVWHVTVIHGYDDTEQIFYFIDSAPTSGSHKYTKSYSYFHTLWGEYQTALVITPIDPTLDSDKDGLPNYEEIRLHTDPFNTDSDGDGISDKTEIDQNSNPLKISKLKESESSATETSTPTPTETTTVTPTATPTGKPTTPTSSPTQQITQQTGFDMNIIGIIAVIIIVVAVVALFITKRKKS